MTLPIIAVAVLWHQDFLSLTIQRKKIRQNLKIPGICILLVYFFLFWGGGLLNCICYLGLGVSVLKDKNSGVLRLPVLSHINYEN